MLIEEINVFVVLASLQAGISVVYDSILPSVFWVGCSTDFGLQEGPSKTYGKPGFGDSELVATSDILNNRRRYEIF